MKYKLILFSGTLFLLGSTLMANELSLDTALEIALQKNIGIEQASNNTEVTQNSASLAYAGLLPRLDLSTGTNYTDATNQTLAGEVSASTTRNTAGLNASYTLFKGLQGVNTYKLLKTQASAAELQETLAVEKTLMAVSQAYFGLLMSFDNLNILHQQMNVSRERLSQALDKNARGMSSSLQALTAQVDFDSDSSAVIEAEYAYAEARRSLNLILGWGLDESYEPNVVDRKFGDYQLSDLLEIGLTGNTGYVLSQNRESQSQLNLKTTLGSVLPTIAMSGSYGLAQVNSDFDLALDNPDLSLSGGLSLSWNLFDGRKGKSLQSAKILKRNSELSTLEASRQMSKAIESAHESYTKSLRVLELKQTTLASAQLNFEQTREYFRLGQVGSTQFRDSQVNLSRVQSSLSQARYSAYLDEMNIWLLTGQLLVKTS